MNESEVKRIPTSLSNKIIDSLGGTHAVCSYCRVSMPAVSQWRKRGIPYARIMYLRERFKDLPIMKREEIQKV